MLLLLALLQQPLAARADTLPALHDALDYDITLILPDSGGHLLGQVRTQWRVTSPEPLRIALDHAMRVVWVRANGTADSALDRSLYAREGDWIYVPHHRPAGDTMTTVIRYHGEPREGLVIQESGTHRTMFADNWPDRAHFWLPVQDLPGDKATASLHVEVPAGFRVVATGTLRKVDTLNYGRTVWHYRMGEPVPVYTLVVGVARFAVTKLPDAGCELRCVSLSLWTNPDDSAWASEGPFRRAGEMVDYFSRLVGPFPYEGLAHVEAESRFSGMENATAIFYSRLHYGDRSLTDQVVAHETAHQWFGDAVTEADWHHVWLSEGFATYFEALWAGHAEGDSAFRRAMREAAREATRDNPDLKRPILDLTSRSPDSLLNSNAYQKAAWGLHSLRGIMGDSAFFRGIREYYRRFRNGAALSSDFAAVMSEAAGTDLSWYFTQMLTQPGYPIIEVHWHYEHRQVVLEIRQTQLESWGTYRLPNLTIVLDGKPTTVSVEGRETRVVVDGFSQSPQEILVDPAGWWLLAAEAGDQGRRARERGDRE